MKECKLCKFSTLNESHLKIHIKRHHEITCKKCDYKAKTMFNLKEHVAQNHTKKGMCRYWRQGNCQQTNCQYKHGLINCKFGNNCTRSNCQYEHPKSRGTNGSSSNGRQNINPWINPAFLRNQDNYNSNFPFLVNPCLHCPKRTMGQ